MTIKFNNFTKVYSFEDIAEGTVFTPADDPTPKEIYLKLPEFTIDDEDAYNAINLTTMEYNYFADDRIIPYKSTLTLDC